MAWLYLRKLSLALGYVIAIALAFRVMLLFPEPLLSGDVYRYLSDGRVLAGGHNPYAYTPSDPRINHPEIRSIYPPHAQLLFAAVHQLTPVERRASARRLPGGLKPAAPLAWRLLIVAFDLAAIVLLRRHGFAYATFPPLLFEGTWSGHIDAVAGVLLAIALVRKSGVAAAFAAACASGMKIIPLAALPSMWRVTQKKTRFLLAFAAALIVPVLPFLGGPVMPGFRDYATRWIFNSPLYELLFAVIDRIPTKLIWTHHPLRFQAVSDVVYRHLYTDFLTRAVMAVIAIGLIACAKRASGAVAALLLCSPAVHPWYWLVLVPVSLAEERPWIYVALCAPFSYLLYAGEPRFLVYALCYGVVAVCISR